MDDARLKLLSDDPEDQLSGVRLVESLKTEGDPLASYAVATWHLHGTRGYPIDVHTAASLLQFAADRGVADAAYDLAELIETERLGSRPKRDAFGYHVLASVLGDKDAVEELSRCFYWGIGTFKDRQLAEKLFALSDAPHRQPLAAE